MWIVLLALRRPYTFAVMALLILILGVVAIRNTPTDIFPKIDIPVVSIIWQYNGLPPAQFEKYIATFSEYILSSGVNDVRAMESQTVNGAAIIVLPAEPGHRQRHGAGDGLFADHSAAYTARHDSTLDRPVRCLQRADPAAAAGQQQAVRGTAL